ncbi:DUF885 domain-containing protein [Hellea balneolensis]|uniref:DUF885 domain-containing protein n=1 Tax=Hellea balneolensis TaxID=287478 RepID=UPI00040FD401|nr:DUF885 family protein [Hellea balneolensis]
MTMISRLAILAISTALPISAMAQVTSNASTPPASQPAEFCKGGTVIIVDGLRECRINDSLETLIADFEKMEITGNPIAAGQEGDREALRKLPDVSPEAAENYKRITTEFIKRHAALSVRPMSQEKRLNYDLLGFVLEQRQRLIPFDQARIPFTNDSGFFNQMSYISRQTTFAKIDDYEAYAARLTEIPRYFGQHKANLRRGIQTNMTAAADIMPGIIKMVQNLGEGNTKEHSFFKPFTVYPDTIPEEEQARLTSLGEAAIMNAVMPAYRDLAEFLEEEYLPKARSVVGIGTTEEGREYYRALVRYFTTLDMSPDEVHEIGLKEVARIRAEMDTIIEDLDFKGSFAEFLNFLRTDPQFYATSEDQLLKEAAWMAKQLDGKMPEFFETLPRLSYGVIPVPAEIAPNYTTGRYWGGNPEQHRAGNYVVNTYDLKQRPLYNLPALTAHEGVPGHHHQIALGQELEDVPPFRQSLYPNAFGEGWGLYSEKLAKEMGLYKTPYENFGRLTYEMWRACRLVVDTGMHWKGWTREQAENCFFENSALAPHNIKTEVDRYISWPGQALAYKIGELKILELRKRAETQLGEAFDIRKFHDAILLDGGMPLDVLERKIDRWIFAEKSRPEED